MKTLRQLAISGTSLDFALKTENGVVIYQIPIALTLTKESLNPKEILEHFLKESVEIIEMEEYNNDKYPFSTVNVEKYLTPKQKKVLQKLSKNPSTSLILREYDHPNRFVNFLLKNFGKILGFNKIFFLRNRLQKFITSLSTFNNIPLKITECTYYALAVVEDEIPETVQLFGRAVERSARHVKNVLTPTITAIRLADTVGDGLKRYAVVFYFFTDKKGKVQFSKEGLIEQREGQMPIYKTSKYDPEQMNIQIIKIPSDYFFRRSLKK